MVVSSIPRIDVGSISVSLENIDENSGGVRQLSKHVINAFRNTGFMIIHNHGINLKSLLATKHQACSFFKSSSCKRDFDRKDPSENLYGYTAMNSSEEKFDRNKPIDVKETFEFMSDKCQYPTKELADLAKVLSDEFCLLFTRMLRVIGLGVSEDSPEILEKAADLCGRDGNSSAFRAAFYPSVDRTVILPGQERCGLHCDYGALTFIYKDAGEKGLMSKLRAGDYVDVFPDHQGDLIVNAGECLQMFTGDIIRAAPHKVVWHQSGISGSGDVYTEMFSLVFFGLFNDEAVIDPRAIHGAMTKYEPFRFAEYFKMRINKVFKEGQGLIDELLET